MSTRRLCLSVASVSSLVCALSLPAQAAIVVNIGSLDLLPGKSGNVEVTIASDNGTDRLDIFGAAFLMTTSGTTRLQFTQPSPDSQLTDARYIFDGDSAGAMAPPVGTAVAPPYDTYIGGDGTRSGSGVLVPLTNPPFDKLLVTLQVTVDPANPPRAGDRFTIDLLGSAPNTFFCDPSFADIPFTSTSGVVNIVPEPGGLAMLLCLAASLGFSGWRRFHQTTSSIMCLVLAVVFSVPFSETAFGGTAVKIMCLGDSITAGYPVAGGYRDRLCTNLSNTGCSFSFVGSDRTWPSTTLTNAGQVNHEGHGGFTIQQIEDNLDGDIQPPRPPASSNNGGHWLSGVGSRAAVYPDVILLHVGANDVGSISATSMRDRLDSLIGHIFEDRPNVALVVASLIPRTDTSSESATEAYNALIPDLVTQYTEEDRKIYFLDMHSKLTTADLYDGVHPDQAGYNKMGDAWFAVMQTNGLTPLPEPSSIVILAMALMGLLAYAWKIRK
jgi:lysophospholipase L1-like esterase